MSEENAQVQTDGAQPAVRSSRLLDACPKCGRDRGRPVLRSAPDPAFFIECGHCGHHSTEIDLKPAIESWNASTEGDLRQIPADKASKE
jgi:hypothetical protein